METFQNRRLLSLLTDTSVLPSGAKASRPIPCVCPLHVPMSLPVLVSPPFVVIVAPAGTLEPTIAGGTRRGLRVENYDHYRARIPELSGGRADSGSG